MSYSDKLKESKEKVYNFAIATKILDLMDKLRMDATNSSERRWIWELLQNAKDVGFDDKSVSIEINFDKENSFVEFKHNGKPFTVDNITFLIEQVSTKERKVNEGEKPKTTGKFGTGFLTTHLLSEKVDLSGIVKEPELPYRKFSILLDRSGREIQEITDSVNLSISILEDLDNYPTFDEWNPNAFNTIFRYNLDNKGIEVAEIGIADLQIALPFTLAFLPKIKSVSVPNENLVYELESIENLNTDIKVVKISEKGGNSQKSIEVVVLEDDDVSISIEIERIDGKIHIKEFNKLMPRLFCDFPMIGTEDFYFPVIVNSSLFNPNEPRNGIYLTDKVEQKIVDNKELMKKALKLYFSLLEFASENDWQNMFHLAAIRQPNEKNWISKTWFETELLKPARAKILKTPLIDTAQGIRIAVKNQENNTNVWFPSSPKPEVIERIWDLAYSWIPALLPRKSDIHLWYKVLWSDFSELDLKVISNSIQNQKSITGIANMLSKEESEAITWLNSYFDLLNFEGKFILDITNDKFMVIPNQNGNLKKRTDLSIDDDIEEELKNVLQILGKNIREFLRHKQIITKSSYKDESAITYTAKTQDNVIDEINKVLEENKNVNSSKAVSYLISLFSNDTDFPVRRTTIYDYCKEILKHEIPEKKIISKWTNQIWKQCDNPRVGRLVKIVAEQKNIETLSSHIDSDDNSQTVQWLDKFIAFLNNEGYESQLNLKTAPILPNQNGDFGIKDDLFLDNGEIDEGLKDISANLGYDFRKELLDKDIYLVLPTNRVRTQEQVAEEIAKLIRPLFAEFPRSQGTKQIFKALYLWFSKNKATSENIFEELFKNKHKLYDDDEIADNMQKAEILDEILSEQGMTLDDLLKLAAKGKLKGLLNEKEEKQKPTLSVQDALISLGITTAEELEKALKDRAVYENFSHISGASFEMLQYVLSLIERAKENVKIRLSQLPEYNIANWREIATTVIAGVAKNGNPINIVVRPSDGGQVVFYYSSEKDTLEQASAELWTDDNKKDPQHLTLGRILKRNRIDRISV